MACCQTISVDVTCGAAVSLSADDVRPVAAGAAVAAGDAIDDLVLDSSLAAMSMSMSKAQQCTRQTRAILVHEALAKVRNDMQVDLYMAHPEVPHLCSVYVDQYST